jgi:hypothetical protein
MRTFNRPYKIEQVNLSVEKQKNFTSQNEIHNYMSVRITVFLPEAGTPENRSEQMSSHRDSYKLRVAARHVLNVKSSDA